jgi:hypothetical protein
MKPTVAISDKDIGIGTSFKPAMAATDGFGRGTVFQAEDLLIKTRTLLNVVRRQVYMVD